jgi:hypothetical protein
VSTPLTSPVGTPSNRRKKSTQNDFLGIIQETASSPGSHYQPAPLLQTDSSTNLSISMDLSEKEVKKGRAFRSCKKLFCTYLPPPAFVAVILGFIVGFACNQIFFHSFDDYKICLTQQSISSDCFDELFTLLLSLIFIIMAIAAVAFDWEHHREKNR